MTLETLSFQNYSDATNFSANTAPDFISTAGFDTMEDDGGAKYINRGTLNQILTASDALVNDAGDTYSDHWSFFIQSSYPSTHNEIYELHEKEINFEMLGAVDNANLGSPVESTTAVEYAFQAAADMGAIITGSPGRTYDISAVTIAAPVEVRLPESLVIRRFAQSPSTAHETLLHITSSATELYWNGGTLDGNRGALESLTPANFSADMTEIFVEASGVTLSSLQIIDAMGKAIQINDISNPAIDNVLLQDITTNRVAKALQFSNTNNSTVDQFVALNTYNDNENYKYRVRAIAIVDVDDCLFSNFQIDTINQRTPAVSPTTDVCIALHAINPYSCLFSNVKINNSGNGIDPDEVSFEANSISIIGGRRCGFNTITVEQFVGNGIELSGCADCIVSNVFLDAAYSTKLSEGSIVKKETNNAGMNIHGSSRYRTDAGSSERNRRGVRTIGNILISNTLIQRCGVGMRIEAPNVILSDTRLLGCVSHGLRVEEGTPGSSYIVTLSNGEQVNVPVNQPWNTEISNCSIIYSGLSGLSLRAGSVKLLGGSYTNNGQRFDSSDANRSGIVYQKVDGTQGTLARVYLGGGVEVADTQIRSGNILTTSKLAFVKASFLPGSMVRLSDDSLSWPLINGLNYNQNMNLYCWRITVTDPTNLSLNYNQLFSFEAKATQFSSVADVISESETGSSTIETTLTVAVADTIVVRPVDMLDDEITVAGVGLLGPGTATSTTFTVTVDSASNTVFSGTVTDSTAFSSIQPEAFPIDENDSFEINAFSSVIYPLSAAGGLWELQSSDMDTLYYNFSDGMTPSTTAEEEIAERLGGGYWIRPKGLGLESDWRQVESVKSTTNPRTSYSALEVIVNDPFPTPTGMTGSSFLQFTSCQKVETDAISGVFRGTMGDPLWSEFRQQYGYYFAPSVETITGSTDSTIVQNSIGAYIGELTFGENYAHGNVVSDTLVITTGSQTIV